MHTGTITRTDLSWPWAGDERFPQNCVDNCTTAIKRGVDEISWLYALGVWTYWWVEATSIVFMSSEGKRPHS